MAAQEAALAAASTLTPSGTDSTGSGVGSIAFSYRAADKTFDFLAAGQTLTVTYNVTVTDNTGASSTQPVTITVIGTNDAAVIGNRPLNHPEGLARICSSGTTSRETRDSP